MIPEDPKERERLVNLIRKRAQMSYDYFKPWQEKWVRFYKIYRAISDAVLDSDEPNIFLPYAFGVVENALSTVIEPILQDKPPCRVRARRRQHEKAAEAFSNVAREFYTSSDFQIDYTGSGKELLVTGNAWERDEWASEYRVGKRWKKVPRTGSMGKIKDFVGRMIPMNGIGTQFESFEEVEQLYPFRVGFNTKFPSVFDILPEPNIKKVKDMHWILEQESSVSLADLRNQFWTDPATGEKVPVYDLTELLRDAGQHEEGSIVPIPTESLFQNDYGRESREASSGQSEDNSSQKNDIDRVHLVHMWERDGVTTLAQGKYVIRADKHIYHCPRLPYRLKVYTLDPQHLYGLGAIEPAEHLFYEFNDIHNLSMANWIRLINKMVAIHMDAVPFPDDLKPSAGGKVRVKTTTRVQDAIMPIEHTDVTPSMLNQESNIRGLLEWVLSVSDLSPGTQGTKQTHKTLGGLLEVQENLAKRFATIRRMLLANFQDQMEFMEIMFSQFQFVKIPLTVVGENGETDYREINNESIFTDGEGFKFVIDHDPSYGNENVMRNQLMVYLDLQIRYEQMRLALGNPKLPRAKIEETMRRTSQAFGWMDSSSTLEMPDGSVSPEQELEMMLSGVAVAPSPRENLVQHLVEHTMQINSPKFIQEVQTGKISPETVLMLQAHLQATRSMIQQTMVDPLRYGMDQLGAGMMEKAAVGGVPGAKLPALMAGQGGIG